jgi:RND family efflux transporter MFP subunit
MNFKLIFLALLAYAIGGCNQKQSNTVAEEHEEAKLQYTIYSSDYELFAEADHFVASDSANILSHFTILPGFTALEKGKITAILEVNGNIASQTLDKPSRKGIYSFDIIPASAGNGTLTFEITGENGISKLVTNEVIVYATAEEAHKAAGENEPSGVNTSVFTKEQSWKTDFSTELPKRGPFGQVIKSTAFIKSAPDNEVMLTASTNGIVSFTSGILSEGKDILKGEPLFTVSSGNLADNNLNVKFAEAKSNFEKAEADYNRAKDLSADKIVSEKELLAFKNQYENAGSVFDNLKRNFSSTGQNVTSPISGYIKQIFVNNGAYVEAGQSLMSVSQNKILILTADVSQKYLPVLGSVKSATIRIANERKVYTLEELDGRVLSYGKSANPDNYLIPVNILIKNNGSFTAGSFAEVWLRSISDLQAITIPESAIMEEQGISFVYVQKTPELFEKREVTTGTSDGMRIEIIRGIADNERIVTKGAILIKLSQSTGTLDAHSGHVH